MKGRPWGEREPHPEWFAAVGALAVKTPAHPKGTVLSTLRFPKLPGGDGLLGRSTLFYLTGRLNSALAQEAFPPRGEEITVVANRTAQSYEWLTRDLLNVTVNPDDSVVVAHRPGE